MFGNKFLISGYPCVNFTSTFSIQLVHFLVVKFGRISNWVCNRKIFSSWCVYHQNFPTGNCTAPKGSVLLLSCHYLHRNKAVWGPNADVFNPDNFLPEKVASRHPYSYLPFRWFSCPIILLFYLILLLFCSAGPRNCIGKIVKCFSTNSI